MEWVTVRNPRSGNTARVPRSALPQMPKWVEVKAPKASKATPKSSGSPEPENDADVPSADREE